MKVILFENLLLPEKYLVEVITKDVVKQYKDTYNKLVKDYHMMNDENSFLAIKKMIVPYFLELMKFIEHNIFGLSTATNSKTNSIISFKNNNIAMDDSLKILIFQTYNNLSTTLGEIFRRYDAIKEKSPQDIPSFITKVLSQKELTKAKLIDLGDKLFTFIENYIGEKGRPDYLAKDTINRNGVTYNILYYEPDFKEVKIKTDIIATEVEQILLSINNKKFRDLRKTDLDITLDFQDSKELFFRDKNKASGFYSIDDAKISYRDLVSDTEKKWMSQTIAHELAHKYYDKVLTQRQRDQWVNLFNDNRLTLPVGLLSHLIEEITKEINQKYHWQLEDIGNSKIMGRYKSELLSIVDQEISRLKNNSLILNMSDTLIQLLNNYKYYTKKNFETYMDEVSKKVQLSKTSLENLLFNNILYYVERDQNKGALTYATPVSFIPIDFHSSVYGQTNPEEHFAETFAQYVTNEEVPPLLLEQLILICRIP